MEDRGDKMDMSNSESITCAMCGSHRIRTEYEHEEFTYGEGSEGVQLGALIPVRVCQACAFRFTDDVADEVRHTAICRHFRVMTPGQISDLRKRYGFKRADFARISRIGEASLARWENGLLIQNQANDSLLYLLTFEDNIDRLKNRNFSVAENTTLPSAVQFTHIGRTNVRFRALEPTAELIEASERFELRKT